MVRSQNNNPRRRRSRRPNGKGNGNIDSSGPSVKVRGSARQVYDKYLLLARLVDRVAFDHKMAKTL